MCVTDTAVMTAATQMTMITTRVPDPTKHGDRHNIIASLPHTHSNYDNGDKDDNDNDKDDESR